MSRPSRTFKLRLSSAGTDLLIDAHCHLIRSTRAMVAWGTTLQIAIEYLNTFPASTVAEQLRDLAAQGLGGREVHHVGAPRTVNDIATTISRRVRDLSGMDEPTLSSIYNLALQQLYRADPDILREIHARARG